MSNNIPNVPGNWSAPVEYQAAIVTRLEELLGDVHETGDEWEVDLDGMYAAAVGEVADLVPTEVLMDYAGAPVILSSTDDSYNITGSKVLYVRRQDNVVYDLVDGNPAGPFYECKEVTITEFQKANLTGSLYKATVESPVYAISPNSGNPVLQMLPLPDAVGIAPSNGEVYLFTYPTGLPSNTTSTLR